MTKISTGVEGFDKLVSGGLPAGRSYLVAGEPGTGKTIFCLQYLLAGAKLGEKCVYISIDEKPEHIIKDAESLGWDIHSFLKSGHLKILDVTSYFATSKIDKATGINVEQIVTDILGYVKKSEATRLAIDPISPLVFSENHIPEIAEYIRRLVFAIEDNTGCTTLLTSYVPVGAVGFSQHGIEEFATSGIISLRFHKQENKLVRAIWVRKMRGTQIDLTQYSYEILPKRGIVLRQPI